MSLEPGVGVGQYAALSESVTAYTSLDALKGATGGVKLAGGYGGVLSAFWGTNTSGSLFTLGVGPGRGLWMGTAASMTWITAPVTWADLWDALTGKLRKKAKDCL